MQLEKVTRRRREISSDLYIQDMIGEEMQPISYCCVHVCGSHTSWTITMCMVVALSVQRLRQRFEDPFGTATVDLLWHIGRIDLVATTWYSTWYTHW
jgi:hypothetical protein